MLSRNATSALLFTLCAVQAWSQVPKSASVRELSVPLQLTEVSSHTLLSTVLPLPEAPVAHFETPTSPVGLSSSLDLPAAPKPQFGGVILSRQPSTSNPNPPPLTRKQKLNYFKNEQVNPGLFIGPAFGAAFKMASPPGKGATYYPPAWRQGAAAYGRNYGDDLAASATANTGKAVAGLLLGEDPRYYRSGESNYLRRGADAVLFTLIDRSDAGKKRFAFSNFIGAAAGGYVGNAYLPPGFRSSAHADQRALTALAGFAGKNAFREFSPEIKQAAQKLHVPFIPK